MKTFFKNHGRALKYMALISMTVVPFGLYFAALHDLSILVNILLAGMSVSMLLAIKFG